VIHWVQDIYPEIAAVHFGGLAPWFSFPFRVKRDASWRRAARCIVLGKTMAGEVARHRVIPAQITTIPNWAPRELQNPASDDDRAAQRIAWGLADKFIVAYSGNLGRVHEVAAILAAAEILRDRPDIAFLFLGTGARLTEVRAAVAARRLKNIGILPPAPREALASSLAAADVQLVTLSPKFASLVFPSKLAGVFAAGRPTLFIGPPGGEIASLLETEGCGATVNPSDGAGLAEKIVRWQADAALTKQLGQRARAAYEKIFTFNAALAHWENILE
jgi:glycosyltransferase involved in cell wall biosynthesis